jgi:glyoxylase-like metal-dependent hydrolase (beta-lactamase superfamily II)
MSATATGGAVASSPDALPAELPLAGGQADATLTLHPLLCAVMRGPRGWFERAPGRGAGLKALGIGVPAKERIDIPIVAFLLEHPTAGPVLVDTGFQRIVAEGPSRERTRNLGRVGRLMARDLRMEPRQCVAEQLQARGIEESDLALIVMTHLHFDHASALCDFPAATVLVSAPEWAAAHGRYPFMHGYVPAQLSPAPSYRTIEFAPGAPGDPFAHALDVFGDGSLRLVFTPGHTRGHVSLLARLSDREALLTGDAAYTFATLRAGARPWLIEDAQAFERSVVALAEWDRAHPDAIVIPGHDMPAWEALQERYS